MVLALVELEKRPPRLEIAAFEDACLLKLREHPVHGGQSDVLLQLEQLAKHVFGAHMPMPPVLKDLENLQPGRGGLQAGAAELRRLLHPYIIKGYIPSHGHSITMHPFRHHSASRRLIAGFSAFMALLAIGGCASNDPSRTGLFEPYRINLPQGNYITQAMLERVRPGMSPEQVRDALGSPLLGHIFHVDRWDYVYRFMHPNGSFEQRKVTIRFRNERVSEVQADPLPQREDPADPALPGFKAPPKR